jgi:4-hydroxy-tetrahydrodipicolinate synthase
MSKANQLSGIFAAAVTPVNIDGGLLLDDLTKLLEFLANRSCHGALLLGTTGEGPSFSPQERKEILSASLSIRETFPAFKLLAGTGTPSLDESIQLTREAFKIGFDGVVVLPPYYFRSASEEGILDWYNQILSKAVPEDGHFLVYHIPKMSGIDLSIDFFERLKDQHPSRFSGLKDSSGSVDFAEALGNVFGIELSVFSGTDNLLKHALENHAAGCITAMANVFSPNLRTLWEAFHSGDSDYSREAQNKISKVREMMNQYSPFPPLYKALLFRLFEFNRWNVRLPLTPLSREMEDKVLFQLKEIDAVD